MSLPVELFDLLIQNLFDFVLVHIFLLLLHPGSLVGCPETALSGLFHEALVEFFLLVGPLMLELLVVVVDALVLRVLLLALGAEISILYLFMHFLKLHSLHLISPLLLRLLPELHIERIHHLLLELLALDLVFMLTLLSDVQVIASVIILDPGALGMFHLVQVLLLHLFAFHPLHLPFVLLLLAGHFGLHRQLLVVIFVLLLLELFGVGPGVELVVEFPAEWAEIYRKVSFFWRSISRSRAFIRSNSMAL